MKLRIRDNSVRLRLSKIEVARLAETGSVEDATEFGSDSAQRFVYRLEAGGNPISAVFAGGRLTVFIPADEARRWTQSEQVGISAEQSLSGEKTLRILVEKDFACFEERPGEDESDLFAHPAGKAC